MHELHLPWTYQASADQEPNRKVHMTSRESDSFKLINVLVIHLPRSTNEHQHSIQQSQNSHDDSPLCTVSDITN
jgi:hypothetical protein